MVKFCIWQLFMYDTLFKDHYLRISLGHMYILQQNNSVTKIYKLTQLYWHIQKWNLNVKYMDTHMITLLYSPIIFKKADILYSHMQHIQYTIEVIILSIVCKWGHCTDWFSLDSVLPYVLLPLLSIFPICPTVVLCGHY